MKFNELEDWNMNDKGASFRIIKGGDKNNTKDIVAYVSKEAKVRIPGRRCTIEIPQTTNMGRLCIKDENEKLDNPDVWITHTMKNTLHQKNRLSRDWCDQMLLLLGFN